MSRKIGIFWRYLTVYSATATVVIFVFAALMNVTVRKRYQEIISDDLRKYALFAGEAFRDAFDTELAEADRLSKELGRQTGARITLIAPDGTVLGDSEEDPAQMENHSGRPEIKKAFSGKIGASIRYSTTLKERMSYVAVPVTEDGKVKGVARVSLKIQAIELLTGELTRRVILLSFAIWAVALILTFLFSAIFSSSVKHMVNLTRSVANGDFSKRAIVKGRDELGELATGLNEMSRKLQSLFEQLQTQHDELDAVIDSMTEGVLVLDRDLRVRIANDSFRQMFSIEGDLEGRTYIEVVRFIPLKEMIDGILANGQVRAKRMEFGGRIFTGNGLALTGAGENEGSYVLVFHDVTSDAHLEKIKAEFAANASHELRTPLAAIRGYLETFEDEEPETQRSFIQIIRRNVDRISNLVSDLLLLARLESPTPQINFEDINLLDIADDVMKLVEKPARDKDLILTIDIEPDVVINGDPFLLEQMLLNLLDNAVKYTEHGQVVLQARQEEEKVIIQVSDTGVGIPKEHLPRIFERFYRVDRARSRDLGGTGLGLSIVKHIVQLHDGEIHVDSQYGSGTVFTIYLHSGR